MGTERAERGTPDTALSEEATVGGREGRKTLPSKAVARTVADGAGGVAELKFGALPYHVEELSLIHI